MALSLRVCLYDNCALSKDKFDEVLGLRLAEWTPSEEVVPDAIIALAEQRQQARAEKRWKDADALRDAVTGAGYEIEDTAQGPRVRIKGNKA